MGDSWRLDGHPTQNLPRAAKVPLAGNVWRRQAWRASSAGALRMLLYSLAALNTLTALLILHFPGRPAQG